MAAGVGNPFPGLRPFHESEEHLFFGRERQVDAMVDRLAATRFLAVVGTSGSGKSSLVNCGLRPALHRGLMAAAGSAWRVAQFRPGGDPLGALARALARDGVLWTGYDGAVPLVEVVDTILRLSTRGLADVYRRARPADHVRLLVVVDQFEELFRYRAAAGAEAELPADAAEEATAFVNLLLEARRDTSVPIYVVLTMRSDFLGDCAQFHGLPEAINAGQFLVPRLTRAERRAAIARPAGVGGAAIAPVLLTRLVNDVGDDPDQLSILQHALHRTWARWAAEGGTGPLDLGHYEAIGAMAQALDRHAEEAYEALGGERPQAVCRRLFRALTDRGTDARGVRRPTRLDRLCALTGAELDELRAVIEVFRDPSRSFLMPPAAEPLEPATVVDISHESLMRIWERLRGWTEEEAESARTYRRLSESAALHAAGKASLWRDPELALALEWRLREAPTAAWAELYGGGFEAAMAFLDASRRRRERRRRWAQATAAGGVLFVVLALIAYAENQRQAADQHRQEADQHRQEADDYRQEAGEWEDFRSKQAKAARKAVNDKGGSWLREGALDGEADLFDVRRGTQVTGRSGTRPESEYPASFMLGDQDSDKVARHAASGKGNPRHSEGYNTLFFDDVEPPHWVEWKTPNEVYLVSVALFASHDPAGQRAIGRFELFAREQGEWVSLLEFRPVVPYGGSVRGVRGGTDQELVGLAACFDLEAPRTAREFKAELEQDWGSWGPRVIELDGYGQPCAETFAAWIVPPEPDANAGMDAGAPR